MTHNEGSHRNGGGGTHNPLGTQCGSYTGDGHCTANVNGPSVLARSRLPPSFSVSSASSPTPREHMAHQALLSGVSKHSTWASGATEDKGLDLAELVIQVNEPAMEGATASASGRRPAWHLLDLANWWKEPHCFCCQTQAVAEVRRSLARTSRLDTVFLIHLLWHSLEEYMEKPTNWSFIYMFPCSHYI